MDPYLLLLDLYPTFGDSLLFLLAGQIYVIAVLWLLSQVCKVIGFAAKKLEPKPVPAPVPVNVLAAAAAAALATPKPEEEGVPGSIAAAIAAAITITIDRPYRILSIQPSVDAGWAREGRRDIFSSHRVR